MPMAGAKGIMSVFGSTTHCCADHSQMHQKLVGFCNVVCRDSFCITLLQQKGFKAFNPWESNLRREVTPPLLPLLTLGMLVRRAPSLGFLYQDGSKNSSPVLS